MHSPELCPSQSSCRNRKRSQVNSSSCMTFSPGRREQTQTHTHTNRHHADTRMHKHKHRCAQTHTQENTGRCKHTHECPHTFIDTDTHTHKESQRTEETKADNMEDRDRQKEGGEWRNIKKRWC